jgi:hypothetical protein
MQELKAKDIIVGHSYEAKRPRRVGRIGDDLVNDRQVTYVSSVGNYVQYDSPTVSDGRCLPVLDMDKFLAWVGRDVTDLMPEDAWRTWKDRKAR